MINMADFFWSVIALVLVIEGFMPALCPSCWRKMMKALAEQSDKAMRIIGLVLMVLGAVILVMVHHGLS